MGDLMICLPVLDGEALPPVPKDKSGYELALHMAGAEVLAFEQFGSYQGDWWARVRIGDVIGYVNGSYGSCSGCDAFEADFGWNDDEKPDYAHKLAKFGRDYLENVFSQDAAEKEAGRNADWDRDADDMVAWLKQFRVAQLGAPHV